MAEGREGRNPSYVGSVYQTQNPQTTKVRREDRLLRVNSTVPGWYSANILNSGSAESSLSGGSYKVIRPEKGWTYYGSGNEVRAYQDITEPGKTASVPMGRERLSIEKQKEGKSDLIEDTNKPLDNTAEAILKRRLALIRMKGRASMPGSQGATKDEPTVNVSSGGAIGLNFT